MVVQTYRADSAILGGIDSIRKPQGACIRWSDALAEVSLLA